MGHRTRATEGDPRPKVPYDVERIAVVAQKLYRAAAQAIEEVAAEAHASDTERVCAAIVASAAVGPAIASASQLAATPAPTDLDHVVEQCCGPLLLLIEQGLATRNPRGARPLPGWRIALPPEVRQ